MGTNSKSVLDIGQLLAPQAILKTAEILCTLEYLTAQHSINEKGAQCQGKVLEEVLLACFFYLLPIQPGFVIHSSSKAEPILAWIQEDHTVIVSPVFDNIHFDTFELERYALAVDGFNWELWCRYDSLPKAWLDLDDATAPVK